MFWNEFISFWFFFVAIFSFSMYGRFALNIRSELVWELTHSDFFLLDFYAGKKLMKIIFNINFPIILIFF